MVVMESLVSSGLFDLRYGMQELRTTWRANWWQAWDPVPPEAWIILPWKAKELLSVSGGLIYCWPGGNADGGVDRVGLLHEGNNGIDRIAFFAERRRSAEARTLKEQ